MEEQVVMIYAGGAGHYDKLPVQDVRLAGEALIKYLKDKHTNILHSIRTTGKLDEIEDALKAATATFFKQHWKKDEDEQ